MLALHRMHIVLGRSGLYVVGNVGRVRNCVSVGLWGFKGSSYLIALFLSDGRFCIYTACPQQFNVLYRWIFQLLYSNLGLQPRHLTPSGSVCIDVRCAECTIGLNGTRYGLITESPRLCSFQRPCFQRKAYVETAAIFASG